MANSLENCLPIEAVVVDQDTQGNPLTIISNNIAPNHVELRIKTDNNNSIAYVSEEDGGTGGLAK